MNNKLNVKATSTVSSISTYISGIVRGEHDNSQLETYGHLLNNLIELDPTYMVAVEENPHYNPSHQIIYMGMLSLAGLTDHVFKINRAHVLDALLTLTLPTVIRILKTVPHEYDFTFDMSFYADLCGKFTPHHARALEDCLGGDLFEYSALYSKGAIQYGITKCGESHCIGLMDNMLRRWDQLDFIEAPTTFVDPATTDPIVAKLYKMPQVF